MSRAGGSLRYLTLALLAGVSALPSVARAQSSTDLGTLGGKNSAAFGVSANGSVIVGYSYTSGDAAIHAYSYSNNTMTDLGTLGGKNSIARGVSADGSVIVGYSDIVGNTASHAFSYSNNTMTDLGTLGGTNSTAYGVSANGGVIVGYSNTIGNTVAHAFSYSNNAMTDLGTLGGTNSSASGVSANGSVIVGGSDIVGNTASHAFSYSNNTMTDLGTLGGKNSGASGVSANGSVIVGSSDIVGNTASHAFSYSNNTMTDLGTLGGTNSTASGVSADGGVIVGYSDLTGGAATHAFLYSNNTMTDIGTLGGTNSAAFGVSADGSVVVGFSQIQGNAAIHAFAYRNGKLIDVPNTVTDLAHSSSLVRNSMVQRSAALALMMDYDCTAPSAHNVCASYIGRYSNLSASNNEGAGGMVLSYRLGDSLRAGAFIDYRGTQASTSGISYGNDNPTFGGFLAFDQNGDQTGFQAKVAGAINRGDVTVTRLTQLSNTEPGQGTSSLTSYALSAKVSWGLRLSDRWIASPFAGVRLVESKLGAYSEARVQKVVEFPISYGAYSQRATFAMAGAKLDGMLTDKLRVSMELGGEYNLSAKESAYTGTSEIPQLTSIAITPQSPGRTIRPSGALGLSYDVTKSQRAGIRIAAQTLPFSSDVGKSVIGSYEIGF